MKSFVASLFISVSYLCFGVNPESSNDLKTAANVSYLSPFEKEVVYEINLFRSNPAKYAKRHIAPLAKKFKENDLYYPKYGKIPTKEGVEAVRECVKQLKMETPKSILYADSSLTKVAFDHQTDLSKTGKTGHIGSDNSTFQIRIERYGFKKNNFAENIDYGNTSARRMIVLLLIDDGVKNRGHRKNMLKPEINLVGVSCGPHPIYLNICVMDFARGIAEDNEK